MAYRHVTTGLPNNLTSRHRKSANSCVSSVSGGRRKCPYNGDKLWARAITRATSRIVTIILYLVNFLRSQILSITSYCRYFLPIKSYRHPALKEPASTHVVYDASAILAAKVRIFRETCAWKKKKVTHLQLTHFWHLTLSTFGMKERGFINYYN